MKRDVHSLPGLFAETAPEKISTLDQVLQKYGWSKTLAHGEHVLINSKGHQVCTVVENGRKYKVVDLSGAKLIDGRGQLAKSIEKLLTQYYFALPATRK
jgi:hypothetical protein